MAHDYEIREWLGGQWDEDSTRTLIEAIQSTGTDDEEVWTAVCQQHDGETLDHLRAVRESAADNLRARVRLEWLTRHTSGAGWTKSGLAEAAGITRATLDAWLREG